MPTVKNLKYYYINNDMNEYTSTQTATVKAPPQKTGWHMIPNNRWWRYFNPKQWYEIQQSSAGIRVNAIRCKVSNMIPITSTVAISNATTFSAFNNTLYAVAYDDKDYSTIPMHKDIEADGSFKNFWTREGAQVASAGTVEALNTLPQYVHNCHRALVDAESINWWDPFSDPDNLMELRPGKNAIQFEWHNTVSAPTLIFEGGCWHAGPYVPETDVADPNKIDDVQWTEYTPNPADKYWHMQMIEPGGQVQQWIRKGWQNMSSSLQDWRSNTKYRPAGDWQNFSETYNLRDGIMYTKPIPNWFIKIIPLFDKERNNIVAQAQVMIVWEMDYELIPRHSAGALIFPNSIPTVTNQQLTTGASIGTYGVLQCHTGFTNLATVMNTTNTNFHQASNIGDALTTYAAPSGTTTVTDSRTRRLPTTISSADYKRMRKTHEEEEEKKTVTFDDVMKKKRAM
uniref:Capsid protein n=1 Tax=Turdus naumanni Ichthamaparvovirus TaxID=2794551 RepID=A0A9Y1EIP2_9VIRU|nr:MAG: capsid protein [Turdus naumanni Ichthamaparvovirus]